MSRSADLSFDFQPVIIIGAARSGTNMLRDMLTRLSGVATWPCDEINYIWRHGNRHIPHDEFDEAHASKPVRRYIRKAFQNMGRRAGCRFLIEKTCANSLRVEFTNIVIPEAKYIFLVRDGRDVVSSALKRWKAPLDPAYLMKKVWYVPTSDLPYYAGRYLGHRLYRMVSSERRLKTWGPRWEGMEEVLKERPLDEACALQWARSVDASARDFASRSDKVFQLRYEDFVTNPAEPFAQLLDFLKISAEPVEQQQALASVFTGSAGGWRKHLPSEQIARLEALIGPTLERQGYSLTASSSADHEAA